MEVHRQSPVLYGQVRYSEQARFPVVGKMEQNDYT
jgi:hypothetical protein